jgi:tetratricopeptide (TPR) repeat protein
VTKIERQRESTDRWARRMLSAMAAAASIPELPPVTTLRLVRRDEIGEAFADAESLLARQRYVDAAAELHALWDDARHDPVLALRQRLALAWCELYLGELDAAADLLEHAETIARSPRFDAADRAEVLFRQGCVTFNQGEVAEAAALFTRALETNQRSPEPRLGLSSRAHEWRTRCHVCRRDWDAAARDVERAIELAVAAGDDEARANALFQASIVAERRRNWLLAHCHAEEALELYRELGNRLCIARVLNNLGGIDFLLGRIENAEQTLLEAIDAAFDAESEADFAQAVNSLAQVYLRSGRPAEARARALRSIQLLENRTDFRDELGNAQLVVAGSYRADGDPALAAEWLECAEATFASLGSTSHLAAVWVEQGDLARAAGDVDHAADCYRRAAEALQDVHF